MTNTILNEIKAYKLSEINHIIGGILNFAGEDIVIKKLAPPKLADAKTLALAITEEEITNLAETEAKAAIVPLGVSIENISTIEVERPKLAMMKLLHLFYIPVDAQPGIHITAVVDSTATIGQNVSIGPNVVIGRDVVIGDNTKILANTYIGKFTKIGINCLFHAGVNIGDCAKIGNNVIIHHNTSIAADGFSFITESPGTIEVSRQQGKVEGDFTNQKIYKIPSLGSVTIGDNVEIGANSCIDSGTVENTVVGKGTKIDHHCHIGHNVIIGKNCIITAKVVIGGSTIIGDDVWIGPNSTILNKITIGNNVYVGSQTNVIKDVPDNIVVVGNPAKIIRENIPKD